MDLDFKIDPVLKPARDDLYELNFFHFASEFQDIVPEEGMQNNCVLYIRRLHRITGNKI